MGFCARPKPEASLRAAVVALGSTPNLQTRRFLPGKTPQKSWEKGVSLVPEGLRWGSAAVPRVPASVSPRVAHPCKANPCWSSRACPLLPGDGFWGPGGPGQGEPGQEGAPQDAAAPGRCGAGRKPGGFVRRRAREPRLKKAPLRSERLASTVPYCGAVTLPFTLLLLSNTPLFHFLLSPIHSPGFSLPSRPCCFHFFCLKFLRGRFYFQPFD